MRRYEGELADRVATMTWGREAAAQYGELGAGRQKPTGVGGAAFNISAYWDEQHKTVLPHVYPHAPVGVGEADRWVEPFDFRLCFTNSPSNQVGTKSERTTANAPAFWAT
jgi:hypothetical protein